MSREEERVVVEMTVQDAVDICVCISSERRRLEAAGCPQTPTCDRLLSIFAEKLPDVPVFREDIVKRTR